MNLMLQIKKLSTFFKKMNLKQRTCLALLFLMEFRHQNAINKAFHYKTLRISCPRELSNPFVINKMKKVLQ